MAAFEVIALDTATPQLRAPGASDTYTFPRAVEMPLGTANGVLYLNGSKVVSSGSGLVYDSSGNLGLGVTPSAWGAGYRAFQIGTHLVLTQGSSDTYLGNNWLNDGTNKYLNNGAASIYGQASGEHRWFTAPSGTAGNAISFTQAMVLDASGNLGIGTSSPATYSFAPNLVVATASSGGLTIRTGSSNYGGVFFADGTTGDEQYRGYIQYNHDFAGVADYMFFGTAGATKMILDSSGNLGLGVMPSAWTGSGGKNIEFGATGNALFGSASLTAYISNANFDSSWKYSRTGFASRYEQQDSNHRWFTAPSGTAGNAISFTQALTLDANRNLALNTTSVGTSAVGVLSVGSGTEPSSGPADTVQIYSVDRSAGNTIPAIYCEGSGVTNAGITNVTVTNKIAIKVNGTVYYLLATTVAT